MFASPKQSRMSCQASGSKVRIIHRHEGEYRLEPISTSVGKRWHLCERRLRLLASANHLHLRTFAVTSEAEAEEEVAHLQQRGEAWLLSHIQHTAGVSGFFATLAQLSRQQPGQALCWWETGAACERRYRVGDQWHNLRPDAPLRIPRGGASSPLLVGVGPRHHERARSDHQVRFLCALPCVA